MSDPTPKDGIGHLLDRDADIAVSAHTRPHWAQSGTITFITLRLIDSIPKEVITRWDQLRCQFIARLLTDPTDDWRADRDRLSDADRAAYDKQFKRLREDTLDSCLGQCILQDPVAAQIVLDALRFFDGDRYLLGDTIIMPNHVHFLAAFRDANAMRKQCTSWMRYTTRRINECMGRTGHLWQPEPFDHLVRSEKQLDYLRDYIQQNPVKANLAKGDFLYRRSNRAF
ncbi:Transposase IS200 like [Neorhodopirellula lusitana]|uniref:Transposase IS200 like n=1 Tax=Neorhodopirellula lusitana TaxID=445327 RepID=A0ABY1Q9J0_9BACT|nr:transposase [Neorhodopirellula lusitana]SMP63134.1 Transposase IS200 like [Neorhodopirellula lusitana]